MSSLVTCKFILVILSSHEHDTVAWCQSIWTWNCGMMPVYEYDTVAWCQSIWTYELTTMFGWESVRGIWVTAWDGEAIESSEPDYKGSFLTPTQNELIILVLPQQFHQQNTFIMMQNICFGLKGRSLSKLSTIFVVLVMWYKLTNHHQE